MITREQYYIGLLKPEYNINQVAYSRLGRTHSEESKALISAARLGKKHSEETKSNISAAMQGKNLSEETRLKLSVLFEGRKLSEETKAKMRAAKLGKNLSEDTRAKISNNHGLSRPILVTDVETLKAEKYSSITGVANALNCTRSTVYSYLKNQKLFKGIYKLEKVNK